MSQEPRAGVGRRDQGEARAQPSLLDRLLDDAPDQAQDALVSGAQAMAGLRNGLRRDLQALLGARRRWRSWPASLPELAVSPIGYGLPDFGAGAFNDPARREALRREIEDTIRRFEPRLSELSVTLLESDETLGATLRLRIEALLQADPAPEPVGFDTLIDTAADAVTVRESGRA